MEIWIMQLSFRFSTLVFRESLSLTIIRTFGSCNLICSASGPRKPFYSIHIWCRLMCLNPLFGQIR